VRIKRRGTAPLPQTNSKKLQRQYYQKPNLKEEKIMETINLLPEISEKSDVILAQLMKAKSEMGSAVKKDALNPFHKSKYASLGAHLDLSEPVLFKHGLLMMPTGNIINGQHVLVATLHHPESGQWLKSYLPLPNPKGDSQGVGASLTYMRRYAINSMFSLNAEDDDGETASGRGKYDKQAPKEQTPPPVQEETQESARVGKAEIIALTNLMNNLDKESLQSFRGWIKKTFKADSIQDIPKACFEMCMVSLNAKIKYLNDIKRAVA
jgi:ERF superfamily